MANYSKPMLRITRASGLENFISTERESAFMSNILNKTDRNVTKVERGMMHDNDGDRTFDQAETIWISKGQETRDLATKAMAKAHALHQENEELRKMLEELETGSGVPKAKLDQEKMVAEAAKAEAQAAKAEAGNASERLTTAEHTMKEQAEEIERMRAELEAFKQAPTPAKAETKTPAPKAK